MSRKNSNDQGFGDLEDDFFNSDPDSPDDGAAKADAVRAEAAKVEAARVEAEKLAATRAEDGKRAGSKKAEAAKRAEADRRAAEAAEAALAEVTLQAGLDAEARREARQIQDQSTRVYKRKSRAELLADEDAADAMLEAVTSAPAVVAGQEATPLVVADDAAALAGPAPAAGATEIEAASSMAAAVDDEEEPPPPVVLSSPTVVPDVDPEPIPGPSPLSLLPPILTEESFPTEVVTSMPTEELPHGAPVLGQPPEVNPAAMLAWTPPTDVRAAWRAVVDELEAAADGASAETRAQILGAAAHLARTRAVDVELAGRLLVALDGSAGPASAQWWRERTAVAMAVGDAERARSAAEGLAAHSAGGAAAEALVVAARIIRDQLGQEQLARAELVRTHAAHPTDASVLVVLREVARAAQDAELELLALDGLATIQTGVASMQAQLERAELLERKLGRPEDAVAATELARVAAPADGATFLALERRYRAAGLWAPLAQLYAAEGLRLAALGCGEDAAWWHARSGRVRRVQLLDETGAGEALRAAVLAAPRAHDLRVEYHVWCAESEQWPALAESLREEIALSGAEQSSFLSYRLGSVLEERLRDKAGALAAYRAAAVDAAASPAAEAVLRLLQDTAAWPELISFLEERLTHVDDPSIQVVVLFRMGEVCEGPLADFAGARKHYERVLDIAPGYLPALEGLERVYTCTQAWAELAAVYEQRAILAEDPAAAALQRHRAGAVYEFRLGEGARAHEQYRLALSAVPDFSPSLDGYTRAMEANQQWAELARVLINAANGTRDSNAAVTLAYRAGRVLADRTDKLADAMSALQKCLDVSPGFLPAVLLLKELAARQGDWSTCFRLERTQADMGEDIARRHWRLFAAAEAAQRLPDADPAELVREVLRDDPAHFGAGQLAERMAWSQSDLAALVDLHVKRAAASQDEAERARGYARAAEVAADAGNAEVLLLGLGEVLAASGVAGRPLGALARVAETAGYPEEALRVLQAAGEADSVDAARLRQNALGDAEGAARVLGRVLEASDDAGAAAMLLRVARDAGTRAAAHRVLAQTATDDGMRAVHAIEASSLYETIGSGDEALACWRLAAAAAPRPGRAFDGLRGALVRSQDSEGLRALFATVDADAQSGLGDALEEAGDVVGAIAAWREQLGRTAVALPWQLRLERGLETAGDWRGLLELVQGRIAAAVGPTADRLAAKARWLLAEKLTESEEAWEFYRTLAEQRPNDVEVLEALARIAGARGDEVLAVSYLDRLSEQSTSPDEKARLQRRRAEVLERSGNLEGARSALTRALDHAPDDREALAGIERLAGAMGDWQGVVGVLARLASLASGREQMERYAQIARTWEDRVKDPAVAIEAWKKVLDIAADDREALGHVAALAEGRRDWGAFVEYGRGLVAHLEGKDRTAFLRRLGEVSAQFLRREDDAILFLESATSGAHADVAAFATYERLLGARGDNVRLVDLLIRRARASTDQPERIELLARAARKRLEALQDKVGAAAIYDEILAADPSQSDALRFRGDFLFDNGDATGAAEFFARLEPQELETDRDDFDAQIEGSSFFYRFAEALRQAGDAPGAIVRYERALGLNPTHLPTLEAVGPLYLAARQWATAEKVYKQLMQLTGGLGQNEALARTYARLGIAEFHLGHIDRARKRLSKALEMRPNDIDAFKGLGLVMAAQEDWNNLLNIYNNIIYHTHEPADVTEAYLAKGLILDVQMTMPEKAGQHYEKSLAFDGAQPLALLRLAELALRRQDWPEAASFADRGLALQSHRSDISSALHLARSIACQACGDGDAAKAAWTAAVNADGAFITALEVQTVEDHDKLHEALRARIAAGAL
ncbi:MAG: hypothetical protein EXR71_05050 [Myxococcales bacterium]|nr:hypothetical protein [Myxococcales bacterium]